MAALRKGRKINAVWHEIAVVVFVKDVGRAVAIGVGAGNRRRDCSGLPDAVGTIQHAIVVAILIARRGVPGRTIDDESCHFFGIVQAVAIAVDLEWVRA